MVYQKRLLQAVKGIPDTGSWWLWEIGVNGDAVLTEAGLHLSRVSLVMAFVRDGLVHPRHLVITTDLKDFRVYHRGCRDFIPLLQPPASWQAVPCQNGVIWPALLRA